MSRKPETLREYLVYLSGWPYWSGMVRFIAANISGRRFDAFVPEKGRSKVVAEARCFVALYAFLGLGSLVFGATALLSAPGSSRSSLASLSCAPFCLPSTRAARMSPVCWKTHAPPSLRPLSAFSRGTCPTMPSTTLFPPYRSIGCRAFTRSSGSTCRLRSAGLRPASAKNSAVHGGDRVPLSP